MRSAKESVYILQNEKTKRLRGLGKHPHRRGEQRKRNAQKFVKRARDIVQGVSGKCPAIVNIMKMVCVTLM